MTLALIASVLLAGCAGDDAERVDCSATPDYQTWQEGRPGGSYALDVRQPLARQIVKCKTTQGRTDRWVRDRLGTPDGHTNDAREGRRWYYDLGVSGASDGGLDQCKLALSYRSDRTVGDATLVGCS